MADNSKVNETDSLVGNGSGSIDIGANVGEGFNNHPHLSADSLDANINTSTTESADLSGAAASSGATGTSMNDFRQEAVNKFRDFASRFTDSTSDLRTRLRDVPANSREVFNRVDTHARSNPWLHIGLAGAGALLLGYVVGRSLSKASYSTPVAGGYDFDQAMDE